MDKLNLLLAIHSHQPVDNFETVFSKAYESAYLPFIEVLERHPDVKISLHYSGSLIEWLKVNQPGFLRRIKKLVKSGQVEILAGGFYEPVLSLIPEFDAQAQIAMLKKAIKDLFSWDADGCWLTERVWEPRLPSILNRSGIKWTIVDDSHFKSSGLNPEELSGYYISEEETRPLAIFPASEKLRYFMPFKPHQETISYLKGLYESKAVRCICFADDGEKFGLWPGTNKWVYREGWLEKFFTALEENNSWLRVISFSQYLNDYSPAGRIYLNCASYREMMEWSGGYFRNFLLKYEEANWMHKRMLDVSGRLNQLFSNNRKPAIPKQRLQKARKHLFMAQGNDAYWHGVFGGLYLTHLRSSIYYHLIEAEKLIGNSTQKKPAVLDLDCDGQPEIIISSTRFSCVLAPHRGGVMMELDYKPKSINLINTLMRRQEVYHQKLKQKLADGSVKQSNPKSIHDLHNVKQDDLEDYLFYDSAGRYCCLDHFLDAQTTLEGFLSSKYRELGDFIKGRYSWNNISRGKAKAGLVLQRCGKVAGQAVRLSKEISLADDDLILKYLIKNESSAYLRNIFGIEFNLSVYDNALSSKSGELKTDYLSSVRNAGGPGLIDTWKGIHSDFDTSVPGTAWHFPIETVSDSETGIEKTYQELCLLFNWPLDIPPGGSWSVTLSWRIK